MRRIAKSALILGLANLVITFNDKNGVPLEKVENEEIKSTQTEGDNSEAASISSSSSSSSSSPSQSNQTLSKVIELNQFNFDKLVKNGTEDKWMVEFYAPWCPHCRHFKSKYDEFSLKATGVKVGAVNCDTDPDLCRRMRVFRFPNLMLFNNSKLYKFRLPRTIPMLLEFVNSAYENETPLKIYTDLPTATESWGIKLQEFSETLRYAYKVNLPFAVLFTTLLALCILIIIFLVSSLIYDICLARITEENMGKRKYEVIKSRGTKVESRRDIEII